MKWLLGPYVVAVVEPLEKELCFHFQWGKSTAKLHEPQHFFGFLGELLTTRMYDEVRASAEGGEAAGDLAVAGASDGAVSLLALGQVGLCTTAAAVYRETYQWSPTSPLLASPVFPVHALNALFDFIATHEARVAHEALLLLTRHVAFPAAVLRFLDAAVSAAAEAFASAPEALWRRALLQSGEGDGRERGGLPEVPNGGVFLTKTVRLVRCVEALVRRLSSTLLLADPQTWRGPVWARLVAATLSAFLSAVQSASSVGEAEEAVGGVGPWLILCEWFELVESLHFVAAAAEDWVGLLFGDGPGAAASRVTSEALDELLLLRDRLTRAAAERARALLAALAGEGGGLGLVRGLRGLEAFLRFMEEGPTAVVATTASSSAKPVLETVLRKGVVESFTAEQRATVRAYLVHYHLTLASDLFLS